MFVNHIYGELGVAIYFKIFTLYIWIGKNTVRCSFYYWVYKLLLTLTDTK